MKKLIFLILPLLMLSAQERCNEKDPREIIEKVRIYKLTEVLDLSDEQVTKFFPHLKEMRKNEQEFHKQRLEILKELKDLIKANAKEQEIAKVLDRFQELQKKRMVAQMEEMKDLKNLLTPLQQAKFLIFQEDFEREIRDLIREVRGRHMPPAPDE
ncbi:MAG: Spy/CpxP family protein refolding chaperone [bacterium]